MIAIIFHCYFCSRLIVAIKSGSTVSKSVYLLHTRVRWHAASQRHQQSIYSTLVWRTHSLISSQVLYDSNASQRVANLHIPMGVDPALSHFWALCGECPFYSPLSLINNLEVVKAMVPPPTKAYNVSLHYLQQIVVLCLLTATMLEQK